MKAVAYLRSSTDEQSLGLEAQRLSCEGYCHKLNLGVELVEFYTDEGLSGALSFEKRVGLLDAIASLEKGDILVVARRDRLARGDMMAIAMIEAGVARKGARIVSVAGEGTESNDPSAVLMRRMVDAFGEYERLIIASRTSLALQAKKSKGECVGYIPFGQKLSCDGVHIEPCAIELDTINHIVDLQATGLTLRAIVSELNKKKILNRRKVSWTKSSIGRLLQKIAA